MFTTPEQIKSKYLEKDYYISTRTATILYLSQELKRPLLIEGPPGVGKTELAKVFAQICTSQFLRIQCYEGLDESKSLYDWNYQKQLLYLQSKKESNNWEEFKGKIYSEEFLLERPLLKAIRNSEPTVLLIDEIDKGDEEFEALLLELLGEGAVTIPELGTIKEKKTPQVFLTSNGSRDLSDPLKRRCFHLYLDYPEKEQELKILKLKHPATTDKVANQIVTIVNSLRNQDLQKKPSVAETIDWAKALTALGVVTITSEVLETSLALLLKNQQDYLKVLDKINLLTTNL